MLYTEDGSSPSETSSSSTTTTLLLQHQDKVYFLSSGPDFTNGETQWSRNCSPSISPKRSSLPIIDQPDHMIHGSFSSWDDFYLDPAPTWSLSSNVNQRTRFHVNYDINRT